MGVDPNLRSPYVADFSLDLQQAITHNVSLDIGYVGNHGTKLISALDINQPSCQAALTPAAIAARRRSLRSWSRWPRVDIGGCSGLHR